MCGRKRTYYCNKILKVVNLNHCNECRRSTDNPTNKKAIDHCRNYNLVKSTNEKVKFKLLKKILNKTGDF